MAFLEPNHEQFFEQPQSVKATNRKARKQAKEEAHRARDPMTPIQPRTRMHAVYIDSLTENELTFGIGPAGAGKTYVPARVYGEMMISGEIKKLYLARPPVAKNAHKQGYLPGDEKAKTAPWLIPIFEGLKEAMGKQRFGAALEDGSIEIVAYEFIQGRTFKDKDGAACIIDEAENLDLDDLYITLTRQGENLRMVLCGDIYQSRIRNSGLKKVVEMVGQYDMESTEVVEFTHEDVVRSRQAKQWARAFHCHRNLHSESDCDKGDGFSQDTIPEFMKGPR
jgi:phosphate starvation-inducible protein PhoH and related proteins